MGGLGEGEGPDVREIFEDVVFYKPWSLGAVEKSQSQEESSGRIWCRDLRDADLERRQTERRDASVTSVKLMVRLRWKLEFNSTLSKVTQEQGGGEKKQPSVMFFVPCSLRKCFQV